MHTLIGLLLFNLTVSGSEEEALLARRAAAAGELRSVLEASALDPTPGARLRELSASGESAAQHLADSPLAARVAKSVVDARWRGLLDEAQAIEFLSSELDVALADLEFEPLIEAELPEGFPNPTPVAELQLKCYPAYRMVRADMSGPRGGGAFWQLFKHITSNDIAMTAPVETRWSGAREASMAFLYGSPDLGQSGVDGSVEVIDIEPAHAVSLGCRGRMTSEAIEAARAQLERWISERDDVTAAGPLRTLAYNSPMVPDRRKYFEVQIPVQANAPHSDPAGSIVVDFSNPAEPERWSSIDDAVMGGVSASRLEHTPEDTAAFTGVLSLENNGGFASVRVPLDAGSLAGARELVLRFRGDGKSYKLRLRTTQSFDGVNYETRFTTRAGTWEERRFPLDEFAPVWRGREVRDAPELDAALVRSAGLMIADEQVGRFRLELATLAMR